MSKKFTEDFEPKKNSKDKSKKQWTKKGIKIHLFEEIDQEDQNYKNLKKRKF